MDTQWRTRPGDIYAAEVSFVNGGGAEQSPAREMQSLHKWARVRA